MSPIEPYKPKRRLKGAYAEATLLNDEGLQALCPSYTELSEADIRFQDGVLLGTGAVKDVYKTLNNHTKRWVAMARLRKDRGPEFYDQFVHEAWLTASLNHPNIITIHDAGIDDDGRPFFSMDLKGNSTLKDRILEQKTDRRELLEIFMKVCDAVSYAHAQGIVHLDLKPENIQADEFGDVLVCDWGLAKMIGEMEDGEDEMPTSLRPLDNMTLLGEIKGSPGYMAPEQVISGAVKDRRTDVFALGCMLHLILTGHAPFIGTSEEILAATRLGEVLPPRKVYPECHIPRALEAVVMKATATSPEDRYKAAAMLRDEISSFLGGFSTLAEKSGFLREARLFLVRNRMPATITSCAILALSVVIGLFIQGLERKQREADQERERAAQEQKRATQFEAKAESAASLYQDELERSEDERQKLARNLATSASNLKKLGIFIRPVETVREAEKLLASAFSLDPDCVHARLQRFSLDCISLNFEGALVHPFTRDSHVAGYLLFAEAFPRFDFSEEHRPTASQLMTFLQHARRINPNPRALMERVIAYDHAARSDMDGYVSVVEALLQYVNDQSAQLTLRYNAEESLLTLVSEERIRLIVTEQWGSKDCLLRFLTFRSFTPVVNERFYLGDLHNLPIETLDLRECTEVVIKEPLSLPMLRSVTIRAGQLDVEELRLAIQANEPIEIIVE